MSFFVTLTVPKGLPAATREQLSLLVTRVAQRFSFQGLDDWQVDLKNSRVLGAETEFHDLTKVGKMNHEMRAYFASKSDAANFAKLLSQILDDVKISNPRKLAKQDWMKLWRKHYKTQILREGQHTLAIVPAWKKVPKSGASVRITPGQAFGTGTHPTTQLCLKLMLRHAREAKTVLDFGAGTGVLLIAAQKVSGAKGTAVESDNTALDQCRKNARVNRARGLKFSTKIPKGKFDLVFANVLAPVLLAHKAKLHAAVKKNGLIFLSGILASEAKSFLKDFTSKKFSTEELLTQGDWSAIALRAL